MKTSVCSISASFTRTFTMVRTILQTTHYILEAFCFQNVVCCFEYVEGSGKYSCKCCWLYSCAAIIWNLYVTIKHHHIVHTHSKQQKSETVLVKEAASIFIFYETLLEINLAFTSMKLSWQLSGQDFCCII